MKYITCLFLLFTSLSLTNASEPWKHCHGLEYLHYDKSCCEAQSKFSDGARHCLETLPKLEYDELIANIGTTLTAMSTCNQNNTCSDNIDFLEIVRQVENLHNITNGGETLAAGAADHLQSQHANLDTISNGSLPSLVMADNRTLVFEDGAILVLEDGASIDLPSLEFNGTREDPDEISHIKIASIENTVDFNHHSLSDVNLDGATLKLNDIALTATAAALNILSGTGIEARHGASIANLPPNFIDSLTTTFTGTVVASLADAEAACATDVTCDGASEYYPDTATFTVHDNTVMPGTLGSVNTMPNNDIQDCVPFITAATTAVLVDKTVVVVETIVETNVTVLEFNTSTNTSTNVTSVVSSNVSSYAPWTCQIIENGNRNSSAWTTNTNKTLHVRDPEYGYGAATTGVPLFSRVKEFGISAPSKVVTTDYAGDVTLSHNVVMEGDLDVPVGEINIEGVALTVTATELNDAGQLHGELTASAQELNRLDGILSTVSELNAIHGFTGDKSDLNRARLGGCSEEVAHFTVNGNEYAGSACSGTENCEVACTRDTGCGGYSAPNTLIQKLGNEFQVNTYTTSKQENPVITALSNGGFVIAWHSLHQDGDLWGVYAQRYATDGTALGNEFLVNNYTTNHQQSPSITSTSNGFVIAWQSWAQDGEYAGIFAKGFLNDGTIIADEFQVNTYTTNNQQMPSIASTSNGFVIVWKSNEQDGESGGIFAQTYANDFNRIGSEFQVNTYNVSDQSTPVIAPLPDGGFVVVWYSWAQDGDHRGIFAQKFDTNNVAVGVEFQVNTYTTSSQTTPSIASLSNGGFVIVWQSIQDGDSWGVYAQRYATDGTALGTEFLVNNQTVDQQSEPDIASTTDGFIITWQSNDQDGENFGIFAKQYLNDGTIIADEFQVNTYTTKSQADPSVAFTINTVVVVWESSDGQDGDDYGIFAQRVKVATSTASYTYGPLIAQEELKVGYDADAVTTHATPSSDGLAEYDCLNPATSGTFKLSANCTLSAQVVLSGDLTIIGQTEDMNNLVTITAAATSRHFTTNLEVNIEPHKLTLWHLKLTGGDVSSYNKYSFQSLGGSILIYRKGEVNLYYSEISGNKAQYGGGIQVEGRSLAKETILNTFNSIIRNNEVVHRGGGIRMEYAVVTITDTIIDHNQASGDTYSMSGGIDVAGSELTLKNTIVSNNVANYGGGGIFIRNNVITSISQTSFINNNGTKLVAGDDIEVTGGPIISLINTVISNNIYVQTLYEPYVEWKTCADNPCTDTPYTGTCIAVNATNEKLGVNCPVPNPLPFSGIGYAKQTEMRDLSNSSCSEYDLDFRAAIPGVVEPNKIVTTDITNGKVVLNDVAAGAVDAATFLIGATAPETDSMNLATGMTASAVKLNQVSNAPYTKSDGVLESDVNFVVDGNLSVSKVTIESGFVYPADTQSYAGTACDDATACATACDADADCKGYTETTDAENVTTFAYGATEKVYPVTTDSYSGTVCAGHSECQAACSSDETCVGYTETNDIGMEVWGQGDTYMASPGAIPTFVADVEDIVIGSNAFALLKTDGSVEVWGDAERGGTAPNLLGKATSIVPFSYLGFIATLEDGSAHRWGTDALYYPDNHTLVNETLVSSGTVSIATTNTAGAILKSDGSIVVFGTPEDGGTDPNIDIGATKLVAGMYAFAALMDDGSVQTWGCTGQTGAPCYGRDPAASKKVASFAASSDNYAGPSCADASACQLACTLDENCAGYSVAGSAEESRIGYSADAVTIHATPSSDGLAEYDCASPATSGTFKLSESCTLSAEVILTGELTIIGQTEDMNNLVTITAAATSRHFKLNNATHKLNLWHLKLTGGDVSSYSTNSDRSGGSIYFSDYAEVKLYYIELSGNKAKVGGAIYTPGDGIDKAPSVPRAAFLNIYNTIVRNNSATIDTGGIHIEYAECIIEDSVIDNNKAITRRAGGILSYESRITISNTMISNNVAGSDGVYNYNNQGGGLAIRWVNSIVLDRVSFDNNHANSQGNNIYWYGPQDSSILLQNVRFDNTSNTNNINGDTGAGTPTWGTCADDPCTSGNSCTAADATDEKLGVTCSASYNYGPVSTTATGTGYAKGTGITDRTIITDAIDIFANSYGFAALHSDGVVTTWGDSAAQFRSDNVVPPTSCDICNNCVYDANAVHQSGVGCVVDIVPNDAAWALLYEDGTVKTLGHEDYGGCDGALGHCNNTDTGATTTHDEASCYAKCSGSGYCSDYRYPNETTCVAPNVWNVVSTRADCENPRMGCTDTTYTEQAPCTALKVGCNVTNFTDSATCLEEKVGCDDTALYCTEDRSLTTEADCLATGERYSGAPLANTDSYYMNQSECEAYFEQQAPAPPATLPSTPSSDGLAEWTCSNPERSGTFKVSSDCQLNRDVFLGGELTLIGQGQTMDTLKTITADDGINIFELDGDDHKLNLWHLKLTGGDNSGLGGAIRIASDGGELNMYYSEVSGNNGQQGGGIAGTGASDTNKNAIINIYNSIIKDNTANDGYGGGNNGGGIYLYRAVATIQDTTIDSNQATDDGGGLAITSSSDVTMKNVIISNNNAGTGRDGGGMKIAGDSTTVILRQSSFINNDATYNGDEIYTYESPTISLINTYFNNPNNNNNIYEDSSGTPTWKTCSNNLCTETPFDRTCSAVNSNDVKQGVTCSPMTVVSNTGDVSGCFVNDNREVSFNTGAGSGVCGDLFVGYSENAVSSPVTPDTSDHSAWPLFTCGASQTSGQFRLVTSCTLPGQITLTGDLTIVGQTQDMDNLVTITAAANNRHFLVNDKWDFSNIELTLWHVKLTGGVHGVATGGGNNEGRGGAIRLHTNGKLSLYYSELSGNKVLNNGGEGGAIYAESDCGPNNYIIFNGENVYDCSLRDSYVHIYNSVIKDNECDQDDADNTGKGGGFYMEDYDVIIKDSIIHNNKAGKYGAMYFHGYDSTDAVGLDVGGNIIRFTNTLISNNQVTNGGDSILVFNGGDNVALRGVTFSNNANSQGAGGEIIMFTPTGNDLNLRLINSDGYSAAGISSSNTEVATCSDNPCEAGETCVVVDANDAKSGVRCATSHGNPCIQKSAYNWEVLDESSCLAPLIGCSDNSLTDEASCEAEKVGCGDSSVTDGATCNTTVIGCSDGSSRNAADCVKADDLTGYQKSMVTHHTPPSATTEWPCTDNSENYKSGTFKLSSDCTLHTQNVRPSPSATLTIVGQDQGLLYELIESGYPSEGFGITTSAQCEAYKNTLTAPSVGWDITYTSGWDQPSYPYGCIYQYKTSAELIKVRWNNPSGGSWDQAECTSDSYQCVRKYTDMDNLVKIRTTATERRGGLFEIYNSYVTLNLWYLDLSMDDTTDIREGGTIKLGGTDSKVNLYYCKIHSSIAQNGGAITVETASRSNGIYTTQLNIFNSVFKDNMALKGAVIHAPYGVGLNIKDSLFEGNLADTRNNGNDFNVAADYLEKGGVFVIEEGQIDIKNSQFINNGCPGSGRNCHGGVFYYSKDSSSKLSFLNIEYSTFTNNVATSGNILYVNPDDLENFVHISLKNNAIPAATDIVETGEAKLYNCENNLCGDQTCAAVDTNHTKLGVKCTYPAGTYNANTYVWNPNSKNTWDSSTVNTWDPRSVNAWDNSSVNTWYDTNPKIWSPIEWIVHEPDTEVRTCKPSSLRDVTKIFSATHNDGNGPTGSITFVALKSDKTIVNWGYNENGGCKNDGTGCSDGSDKNKAACLVNNGCSDGTDKNQTACTAPVGCSDGTDKNQAACTAPVGCSDTSHVTESPCLAVPVGCSDTSHVTESPCLAVPVGCPFNSSMTNPSECITHSCSDSTKATETDCLEFVFMVVGSGNPLADTAANYVNVEECQTYSDADDDLTWMASGTHAGSPKGCFRQNNKVYFGTTGGSVCGNTYNSNCVQKRIFVVVSSGDPLADTAANYVNVDECQTYSDADDDLTWMGSATHAGNPKGCFRQGNKVYFGTTGGGATGVCGNTYNSNCVQKTTRTWTGTNKWNATAANTWDSTVLNTWNATAANTWDSTVLNTWVSNTYTAETNETCLPYGVKDVTDVVFSDQSSITALTSDGDIVSWGKNHVVVDAGALQDVGATKVVGFDSGIVALLNDKTVKVWGKGSDSNIDIGVENATDIVCARYGTGYCKDQNGVVNSAETHSSTCVVNSFCANKDEIVGNGASYSDKTTCETASDCGPVSTTTQCVFTKSHIYTHSITPCSDPSATNKADCEALSTCSDSSKTTEATCGACNDASKDTGATCINSFCSIAEKTSQDTCGVCDDNTTNTATTCISECSEASFSTETSCKSEFNVVSSNLPDGSIDETSCKALSNYDSEVADTNVTSGCIQDSNGNSYWNTEQIGVGYDANAVQTHTAPSTDGVVEYDCASPATSGTFKLSADCTLSGQVTLAGELTIIGVHQNPTNWDSRTLSFTNVNADHYTVAGSTGEDPTLRLCAGDTYSIKRATDGHGLNIKTGGVDQLNAVVTSGSSQSWTPTTGTYQYYCVAHPTQMLGDIIVESCGIPTVTAAATSRHFKLDGATYKLNLWHLKLTGGDVSSYTSTDVYYGGSIEVRTGGGELNLYYLEISGNKARSGGGISGKGADVGYGATKNVIIKVYNSIIKDNEATHWHGGGIHLYRSDATIKDSIIDGNNATNHDGGGISHHDGSLTITNTILKNNNAGRHGGAIRSWHYHTTATLRQVSFINNDASGNGNIIATADSDWSPIISVINTDIDTNDISSGSKTTWSTCADNPCTEAPFNGTCSAVDSSDDKGGVLCSRTATAVPVCGSNGRDCLQSKVVGTWTNRTWTPATWQARAWTPATWNAVVWNEVGVCKVSGCTNTSLLTQDTCLEIGTCASIPITRATSLSIGRFTMMGTTSYTYNSAGHPDISLCIDTNITFTRPNDGFPLRVVKDTDCTGCDAGTPAHNDPNSTLVGWVDVAGSSSETYNFDTSGIYYYLSPAESGMVGKLILEDCSKQVGQGAAYDNNKTACDAATDCGAHDKFQCEFTETYAWQPEVKGHEDNEESCMAIGTCASADGVVGLGAQHDNNITACEAATNCGLVAKTDACIWHEHEWVYDRDENVNTSGYVCAAKIDNAFSYEYGNATDDKGGFVKTLGTNGGNTKTRNTETLNVSAAELSFMEGLTLNTKQLGLIATVPDTIDFDEIDRYKDSNAVQLNYVDLAGPVGSVESSKVASADASGNVQLDKVGVNVLETSVNYLQSTTGDHDPKMDEQDCVRAVFGAYVSSINSAVHPKGCSVSSGLRFWNEHDTGTGVCNGVYTCIKKEFVADAFKLNGTSITDPVNSFNNMRVNLTADAFAIAQWLSPDNEVDLPSLNNNVPDITADNVQLNRLDISKEGFTDPEKVVTTNDQDSAVFEGSMTWTENATFGVNSLSAGFTTTYTTGFETPCAKAATLTAAYCGTTFPSVNLGYPVDALTIKKADYVEGGAHASTDTSLLVGDGNVDNHAYVFNSGSATYYLALKVSATQANKALTGLEMNLYTNHGGGVQEPYNIRFGYVTAAKVSAGSSTGANAPVALGLTAASITQGTIGTTNTGNSFTGTIGSALSHSGNNDFHLENVNAPNTPTRHTLTLTFDGAITMAENDYIVLEISKHTTSGSAVGVTHWTAYWAKVIGSDTSTTETTCGICAPDNTLLDTSTCVGANTWTSGWVLSSCSSVVGYVGNVCVNASDCKTGCDSNHRCDGWSKGSNGNETIYSYGAAGNDGYFTTVEDSHTKAIQHTNLIAAVDLNNNTVDLKSVAESAMLKSITSSAAEIDHLTKVPTQADVTKLSEITLSAGNLSAYAKVQWISASGSCADKTSGTFLESNGETSVCVNGTGVKLLSTGSTSCANYNGCYLNGVRTAHIFEADCLADRCSDNATLDEATCIATIGCSDNSDKNQAACLAVPVGCSDTSHATEVLCTAEIVGCSDASHTTSVPCLAPVVGCSDGTNKNLATCKYYDKTSSMPRYSWESGYVNQNNCNEYGNAIGSWAGSGSWSSEPLGCFREPSNSNKVYFNTRSYSGHGCDSANVCIRTTGRSYSTSRLNTWNPNSVNTWDATQANTWNPNPANVWTNRLWEQVVGGSMCLQMEGDNPRNWVLNSAEYTDAEVKCYIDDVLDTGMVVSGDVVNWQAAGAYNITYTCKNQHTVTRRVNVN